MLRELKELGIGSEEAKSKLRDCRPDSGPDQEIAVVGGSSSALTASHPPPPPRPRAPCHLRSGGLYYAITSLGRRNCHHSITKDSD